MASEHCGRRRELRRWHRFVKTTPGAIGYVDYADTHRARLDRGPRSRTRAERSSLPRSIPQPRALLDATINADLTFDPIDAACPGRIPDHRSDLDRGVSAPDRREKGRRAQGSCCDSCTPRGRTSPGLSTTWALPRPRRESWPGATDQRDRGRTVLTARSLAPSSARQPCVDGPAREVGRPVGARCPPADERGASPTDRLDLGASPRPPQDCELRLRRGDVVRDRGRTTWV